MRMSLVRIMRAAWSFQGAAVSTIVALVAIWPLPHSIALRNILLVILLFLLTPRTRLQTWRQFGLGPSRSAVGFYLAFTLWMLVVAFLFSPFPRWTLGEIDGQWLMGCLAFVIGLAVALQERRNLLSLVIPAVLTVLTVQIASVDIQGVLLIVQDHGVPAMARLGGLSAGPGKASYLTNILLSALVAELALRIEGRRHLRLNGRMLAALISLCCVSVYFEAMRNELFDVLIFVIVMVVTFLRTPSIYASRRVLLFGIGGVVIVASGIVFLSFVSDPRWESLMATVPIALDTAQHLSWINSVRYPLPHLPNGQVVSASNYLRIAWIKEALKTVLQHPLGVGYGRSAFGHALRLRFGKLTTVTGLNNSFLTIAVGTGIPGAIIWLGWFVSMGRLALSAAHGVRAFEARFLLLLLLVFGVRMGLDNDMQNYTLEEFLFFVGLLLPLASIGPLETGSASSRLLQP